MSLQSAHTNWADPRLAREKLSAVYGVPLGAQGIKPLYPWKNPEVNQMCASCHNNVWAAFQEPFTHKLAQGAMSCVDCHNPHGSFLPWQIRTVSANEPNCYQCHSDLRGPFTFEHAPVKFQGCGACHQPHGSTNPRMLIRYNVRQLCLECHANLTLASNLGGVPPAFHDLPHENLDPDPTQAPNEGEGPGPTAGVHRPFRSLA